MKSRNTQGLYLNAAIDYNYNQWGRFGDISQGKRGVKSMEVCLLSMFNILTYSPGVHDRNQVGFLAWLARIPSLVFCFQQNCHSCKWVKNPSPSSGVYWIPLALVQLVLLARKQGKYNCSLSSPPRHWFIHSPLQLGATNLRGSQLIHRTKI